MSHRSVTYQNRCGVALAGLLHDVGKLAQRASWRSGKHTDIGGEFVSAYVAEQWRQLLYPVMGHHDHPLEGHATKVVALADRLSAAERQESESSGARQLVSILCRVGEKDQRPSEKAWPLQPLALQEETLFPGEPLTAEDEQVAYAKLWDGFVASMDALPADDLPTYLVGAHDALREYAWCVPGAYYRSVPDVSLFDHSRTTAALAACLADLEEERLDALLHGDRRDENLVLLVGGDVSGVQDFIYTITAKGAAKGLRGRSFYLEMLTEAVVRYIVRQLDLPITNLLYAGGGHFYLLAPLAAEEQLPRLRRDVSHKLLDHHGGDLYLALGATTASAIDFDRECFTEKWHSISQAMNASKRQRFSELQDPELLIGEVFGPVGEGGDEGGECQVCHYDGPVETEHPGTVDERRICHLCHSLEQLGTDLREADYLVLGEVPPKDARRTGCREALRAFGLALGMTAADGSTVLRLPEDVQRATLLATRDLVGTIDVARRLAAHVGCPVAPGTRYTVNVTPRVAETEVVNEGFQKYRESVEADQRPKPGDVKPFGLIQQQAQGVRRLGVLRMDVDDLGDLFRWGMAEEGTLSRVASLSFSLSLFFEGWVGRLCRQVNDQGPDKVYAIYSGGDDLFIVGAWDALPGLADRIRRDLGRFAAHNPAIHISGGLTLHGGKYPLYQAARDAERALDTAKDYERADEGGHAKDAFHWLGVTVPWEAFDVLAQEKERLVHLVDDLNVNRSLLRTLLSLYDRYRDAVYEHDKPVWGPWMWQGAYTLKRFEDREKDREAATEIGRIRRQLKDDGFRFIETLGPAARWAELLMRKE